MNKEFLMNLKRGLAKRVVPSVLASSLLFGSAVTEAQASFAFDEPTQSYEDFLEYKGIKIFVNGRYVEFNDDMGYPIAINGRTYIPVRAVSETFNSYVYYREWDQTVFVSKHGTRVDIQLGADEIDVLRELPNVFKKETIKMDAKAFAQNNRTYIPLRALFEALGMNVVWNGDTQTIYIVGNYEEQTKYIDFKKEKVFEMKDLDLNKNYSKIIYDGKEIDKSYLQILKRANEYKLLEQENILYVFSYQYLFDLNYIYQATTERKNDKSGEYNYYTLYSVSEEEIDFTKKVTFIDDWYSAINSFQVENFTYGGNFNLVSEGNKEEFEEIDNIVNELVSKIKSKSSDPEEMVRLVNNELKEMITYGYKQTGSKITYYTSIYNALVDPKLTICQGYMLSFKYIMDKLGIPCVVVTGKNLHSGNEMSAHGWNEVYINGEWKLVDVSANDDIYGDYMLLVDPESIDYYQVSDENRENIDLVKLTLNLGKEY